MFVSVIKPNIGHLDGASGMAGLIKGILIVERGIIARSIFYKEPNPVIPAAGVPSASLPDGNFANHVASSLWKQRLDLRKVSEEHQRILLARLRYCGRVSFK